MFPAFQREIAKVHCPLFSEHASEYGPNVRAKIARALQVTDAEYEHAESQRRRYREQFAAALDDVDVVVAPTLPIPPPLAGVDELDARERMTSLTFPLNAVGAPAIALPCGRTPEDMPVSLQLFAQPGEDALVLAAGALLERALRHTPAPGGAEERGA